MIKERLALNSSQLLATIVCALCLLAPSIASAQDPFSKGTIRGSLILGAGQSFDESYTILGVGVGYYVIDGLEFGLNWQSWLGGDPSINQITPEITYVFVNKSNFDPYLGVLYRKTFISDMDDLSAYGGRAGINVRTGQRAYIGFGGVFLKYTGCSENVFTDCSDSYPEILFSFAF